ncbi:MAG: peptidoglycan-associated lipoprotein Pal [Candidatus Aminicenantes bacterium]|nr:peptidoglycan-associated lipoprotein Pal [Candidatus Aminicenantes bacterium]
MIRKGLSVFVVIFCLGFIISGCPKKTVVKEEPSVKSAEGSETRKEMEAKEADRIREEKTKKEFEKSLVAQKTPGIEGVVLESKMLKDIHFEFDKYSIPLKEAEILRENCALLKNHSGMKFQIEGHCDERGTGEYNLALGERRANSTKKYLVSLGIEPGRISTISYGEERPLDQGRNEEAWTKNRRAHFVILKK